MSSRTLSLKNIRSRAEEKDLKAVQVFGGLALLVIVCVAIGAALGRDKGSTEPEKFQVFDKLGLENKRTSMEATDRAYKAKNGGQYGNGIQYPPSKMGLFPDRGPKVKAAPANLVPQQVLDRDNTGWTNLPPGVTEKKPKGESVLNKKENPYENQIGWKVGDVNYDAESPNPMFVRAVKSGAIEEDPLGSKKHVIKSSKGYGFRPLPPPKTVTTQRFNAFPAVQSGKREYRVVENNVCAAEPLMTKMDVVIDTCDAACSDDNGCIAYTYEFSNGTCKTYGSCDQTRPVQAMINLYAKSK